MYNRKVTKPREGYGGGGVNVTQQKHGVPTNVHRNTAAMINKEKFVQKTESKPRNSNDRRNHPYQHNKYQANSNQTTKSMEREAKHLKTAIRRCGDWTEHVSSSGKHYYFDIRTSASQWEKPKGWKDSHAVDVKHQRKSQTKVPTKSRGDKPNYDQNLSSVKYRLSSGAHGIQQQQSSNSLTTNHRVSYIRVPSHDSTSTNGPPAHGNDTDFRSPRNLNSTADRDYRTKSAPHRDIDLRAAGLTPGKSNYHNQTRTPGDKDYRQSVIASRLSNSHSLNPETTLTVSNGKKLPQGYLNPSADVDSTTAPNEKPETGQFYDYSNWTGIRPPPKSDDIGMKQQLNNNRKNESPRSATNDNNVNNISTSIPHSHEKDSYRVGGVRHNWPHQNGDKALISPSTSSALPNTSNETRTSNCHGAEITAEVARTITTVLSQAAAASNDNSSSGIANGPNGIESAIQLVLNAALANKNMKHENMDIVDDAAEELALKRSRVPPADDSNTTPLHDENENAAVGRYPVMGDDNQLHSVESTIVDISSLFTTFQTCRHLVDPTLMGHLINWPTLQFEREVCRLSTECNRCTMALDDVNFEISQARSRVREHEITRMLHEQRVHYLRQQMKEVESIHTPVLTPTSNMTSSPVVHTGGGSNDNTNTTPIIDAGVTTIRNSFLHDKMSAAHPSLPNTNPSSIPTQIPTPLQPL